jgi:murein DD-endopeptidase MepM/ murein hydrolase activator NlpD
MPFLLAAVLILSSGTASARTMKVSWEPSSVRPGAVVAVKVQVPREVAAVEAVAGKERFPLLKTGDDEYLALVGIGLEYEGAIYPLDVYMSSIRRYSPYYLRADLKLIEMDFGEQALSLPTGMVDLSRENLKRVQNDSGYLLAALAERFPERFWKQSFVVPVKGRTSTNFGTRRILNGQSRSPHSGVDIAAPRGTPVAAANSGVVTMVDDHYLTGWTVVVDHGWGVSTLYAHLESVSVREGQLLKRGETLGKVGSTGRATGPHLHFGAFIRGAKVDPVQLIEATSGLE